MTFHVGQKVVCVDAQSPPIRKYWTSTQWPVQGTEYTIAATCIDRSSSVPAVQVTELPPYNSDGFVVWYQAKRFRPITERKTDISIFKKLLNPSSPKVKESAS